MLLMISIIFMAVAMMKFYGLNIIHRIKKISIERSVNKIKYDKIISLACVFIGMVLLVFYLNSSRWFYGFFESELLWHILVIVLFISICLIIYAPIVYGEGIIGKILLKNKNNRGKITVGCYLTMVISTLLLITLGITFSSEYGYNLDVYFLGMDTSVVFYILESLIVISVFLIIVIKKHNNKAIIFISILATLGILLFSLFICAWTTGGDYYSFYSPNLEQSIIIEEWTHLITEDVRVYERENIIFIKRIGSLPINSVSDFKHGAYDVEWEENKAIITLHKGSNNEEICEFVLKD